MKTETVFSELVVIEVEDSTDHQHTMGSGACTKCKCKAYGPDNLGGQCKNDNGSGGTCNHTHADHKD